MYTTSRPVEFRFGKTGDHMPARLGTWRESGVPEWNHWPGSCLEFGQWPDPKSNPFYFLLSPCLGASVVLIMKVFAACDDFLQRKSNPCLCFSCVSLRPLRSLR